MCILFISTNPKPKPNGYRLIIASNRDEYYARPALNAYLDEENKIIGGRDMEKGREGGMWLGVSLKRGDDFKVRFGALLNVTGEESKKVSKGRGPIVLDYLNSKSTTDYLQELNGTSHTYNAFNLATVDLSDDKSIVHHLSNSPVDLISFEGRQILGFGNSTVKSPLKKVLNGKERFVEIIDAYDDVANCQTLTDHLFDLLKWSEKHLPDVELQTRAPAAYEQLSSVFVNIKTAGYGTRAHSILLIDYDWNVEFIEASMEQPIDPNSPRWHKEYIKCQV